MHRSHRSNAAAHTHAQIPSFQCCRPHAVCVRHTHVRSVAEAGCLSEYSTVCQFCFHTYVPRPTYIHVQFLVLLHGARTTAQTTIATVHRACLPPASYSTTTLLPSSSSSSGHTLRVSMIVLRIFLCVIQHCHTVPPVLSTVRQRQQQAGYYARVEDPRCTLCTTVVFVVVVSGIDLCTRTFRNV